MGARFFGLTPETRPLLWEEYFFLVEYGNLGMDTIWLMPVAIRRWWIEKLIDKYEKQNKAAEARSGDGKHHTADSFARMQGKLKGLSDGEGNVDNADSPK